MRKMTPNEVGLIAFLHDIGKFAQRAESTLREDKNRYNYVHAAYTAQVLRDYKNKFNLDEELIDFAAMHHNVKENMDDEYWIIAAADRLASGFERELFEEYNKNDLPDFPNFKEQRLKSIFNENKEYKLDKLHPMNIFSSEEKGSYKNLWGEFLNDLKKIKEGDIFAIDYLYKKYTTFIPSSTSFKLKHFEPVKANIPLYDHSKTTAVFAVAIYKALLNGNRSIIDFYKYGRKKDYEDKPFLLIFGDFFGIQNFIFDKIKAKYASKILRAKSAYIEIITKLVANYIIDKLNLSYFSIISIGAGKFEILANNSKEVKKDLENIQEELNEFFIKEFFAKTGMGVGFVECGVSDFIGEGNPYKDLRKKISDELELIKLNKFSLINKNSLLEYEKVDNSTLCEFCEERRGEKKDDYRICSVCEKFVEIGKKLAYENKFISIKKFEEEKLIEGRDFKIFKNYGISFSKSSDEVYDISFDEEFRNFAKWEISSYVATTGILNEEFKNYLKIADEKILTFEELAKLSVIDGIKSNRGVEAIMALKGDVDFMGNFINGISENGKKANVTGSFAKYNFFSRLVNYFFSVYVPWKMKNYYPYTYTIFAGGDDLFIIGAWDSVFDFAKEIRDDFIRFCEGEMKLSVGEVMTKPNKPINFISKVVEKAEEEAKDYKKEQDYLKKEKNALSIFDETISFNNFKKVEDMRNTLAKMDSYISLPTSFLYRLGEFIEMSKNVNSNPLNAMWVSRFEYLFRRNIEEKTDKNVDNFKVLLKTLIEEYPKESKIGLFQFIYERRKNDRAK